MNRALILAQYCVTVFSGVIAFQVFKLGSCSQPFSKATEEKLDPDMVQHTAYSDGSAMSALLRATLDFWLCVPTSLEASSVFRTAEAEASSCKHTCHALKEVGKQLGSLEPELRASSLHRKAQTLDRNPAPRSS